VFWALVESIFSVHQHVAYYNCEHTPEV